MKEQFIKVTPKGATKPVILRAACKDFYVSQGAKVEEPTEDEVKEEFPSEFAKNKEVGAGKKVVDDDADKDNKQGGNDGAAKDNSKQ